MFKKCAHVVKVCSVFVRNIRFAHSWDDPDHADMKSFWHVEVDSVYLGSCRGNESIVENSLRRAFSDFCYCVGDWGSHVHLFKRTLAQDLGLLFAAFCLLILLMPHGEGRDFGESVFLILMVAIAGVSVGFIAGFYAPSRIALPDLMRRCAFAIIVSTIPFILALLSGGLSSQMAVPAIGLAVGVAGMAGVRLFPHVVRKEPEPLRVLVIAPAAAMLPMGRDRLVSQPRAEVGAIVVGDSGRVPDAELPRITQFAKAHGPRGTIAIAGGVRFCSPAADRLFAAAAQEGCTVTSLAEFLGSTSGQVSLEDVDTLPAIIYAQRHRSWHKAVLVRLIDLMLACLLLAAAAPVMAMIAVVIRMQDGCPVFYRQDRVGLGGQVFAVLKFRTMRQDAEADGKPRWATEGDLRVTRVGAVLRAHRLDELPQLINIIRGEMSLVGPRPERPDIVALLRDQVPLYDYRHCVLPGLTGWAQVNFPYGASVEDAAEKTRYDLYYVQKLGPLLNLLIMFQTMRVVLFAEGSR
jgi:exopolysaccharide biosynthesis polyprenyl glycosylphosphotransferase